MVCASRQRVLVHHPTRALHSASAPTAVVASLAHCSAAKITFGHRRRSRRAGSAVPGRAYFVPDCPQGLRVLGLLFECPSLGKPLAQLCSTQTSAPHRQPPAAPPHAMS
eukprot:352122-Chlamydomonas_euryale.AAC.11